MTDDVAREGIGGRRARIESVDVVRGGQQRRSDFVAKLFMRTLDLGRTRWLRAVLILGALYLVVGLVSPALARSASSNQIRVAWRLAAWVISAVGFGAHIGYEQMRLRSSLATTAFHASLAVGLGAFALGVAARLHSQYFPAFALVVWPVATALPAFVVALAAAAVLARARRGKQPDSTL